MLTYKGKTYHGYQLTRQGCKVSKLIHVAPLVSRYQARKAKKLYKKTDVFLWAPQRVCKTSGDLRKVIVVLGPSCKVLKHIKRNKNDIYIEDS